MNTKLLQQNPKTYLALAISFLLMSAIPFFAGSGLDNAKPMGSYLNNNFPASLPQGLPYEPVFPNLSFDSPLTFNELPTGNKIIVGQRDGRIYWFDKTPSVTNKNLVIDLSEKVGVVWDGGFLGLTLHPNYGSPGNNYVYVYYTTEDQNSNDFPNNYTTQSCNSEEYWGNFLILARYEMNPTTLTMQPSSEQVMLKLRMYGTTHRGGGLLFGDDGFLYLTTGDQTAFKKSQDIHNNLDGGVLRFDVDQDSNKSHPPVRTMPDDHGYFDEITGVGYYIPNDNPFLSPTGENFEEYYSMGHRNPHRMTKDRNTGELYVGEIGGGRHEEINIIKKGKNFGWPLYEGLYYSTFCVDKLYNDMPHERPLVSFPRAEANAIIGGFVYRGNEVPELQGKYICADYGNGEEIFTVNINTGAYEQYGNFTSTNIISFGEDKQGELYILKQGNSSLFKLTSKNSGFGNTPRFLSQTGAFSNLSNLTPTDGLVPYDLVESFWSDGALKKRWMAIPNNNDGSHDTAAEKINYSEDGDWDFPIGTVLVKHFELPINENNPTVTKRLETRFSIKADDGNFYFVTYKWNDQQTDAELLTGGLDEDINIVKTDGSTEVQTWSYPSNIDCITCHNPATGGTLGTRARYLNKDYTYEETGRTANQLVTLSHLGILDQAISDADTNTILTSKSINDVTATIDEKARSYMDLNCAYCHQPGTGNRGDFDLRLNLDIVQTGLLTASPYLPLGIPNEKIVDAGNPETSILYHRVNSTDPAIRMPPIAKNKLDQNAVQLIDDWISQLDPEPCTDRIIMETFTNVPGTTLAELRANANFPNNPSETNELDEFRIPINVDDDYGVRVKGLLKAPETGTYYFWVTGDDNVELSLSTTDSENNKVRIAYHDNWSYDGEWNKFATQKSSGINLVAGQNYYIEALMNERGGGDNLSVGWRKPSNGNGTVPFQVIPCTAFDFFNGPPVVNVSDVAVTPESLTLIEGVTQQLTATVSPSNADDTSVMWVSSDTSVATVNSSGLVTTISQGTATITVITNDGGYEASIDITVEVATIAVTGISVDISTLTLAIGDTQQLTATVTPSDATDVSVTWSSSDENIATVDSTGLVTGISEGNASIIVTSNDGNYTANSTVDVDDGCVLTNVALSGTASQSSTYGNGLASLAIDGITNGSSPWSADLQHTTNEINPWWQLDLGAEYSIEQVSIFNRSDALQSRLNNFYVFVSSSPFASGVSLQELQNDASIDQYFFVGEAALQENIALNAEGRYVRIQLAGSGILHVSEVEILGCFLQASPCDGVASVVLNEAGPFVDTDAVQTLTASPSGGTWSGASTDGTFDPSIGAGSYAVTYTYDNGLGCVQSDTREIVVNTTGIGGCVLTNVALSGTASQSSTYGNGLASLAIDGITNGSSPWSADLQHTTNEINPWWQLDLGAEYSIEQVSIFNRSDALQSRLNNFYVFVSDLPFASGVSLQELQNDASIDQYFFVGEAALQENIALNAEGRYVRIQLAGSGILHVSEVEILGCFLQASPCDGVASVVLNEAGPFVDTDAVQTLTASPSGGTWSGASIDGTFDPSIGAGSYAVTYTYDNGLGCVQSDTREIVVNTTGIGGCVLTNVALSGTASQSSTYGNGLASLAIDGITNGSSPWSADLQHTTNEINPWWQLDLGAEYSIEQVSIFNRSDALQSRLNNFYVFVSDLPFASGVSLQELQNDASIDQYFFVGEAALQENIALNAEGRYVRIQLANAGILHMSEVEVLGCFNGNVASSLKALNTNQATMSLSPVPADDILNISYFFNISNDSPIELVVFDDLGRKVNQQIFDTKTFTGQLDVSTLAPGAYLVQLKKEDEIIVKRFTVNR